jgi:hypothetical protein
MKVLLTSLLSFSAVLNAFAQGVVSFSNARATDAQKVWVGATGTANGGMLAPVGTYYNVALYYDPLVDQSLTDTPFVQIGPPASFGILGESPGVFHGGNRTIPVGNGGVVNFQVRIWQTAFGTSYEQVLVNGGFAAKSWVFRMDTAIGQEPVMNVLGTGTFTTGWTGFAIVPEPSVMLLGLLGVGSLLLLRRKS